MAALTMAQAYAYARQAGFDPGAATVMAAIDMAESGLNPAAVGDVALENSTWGPSIGLAQIRTLKSQTGTGGIRDVTKLRDPLANMTAAYEISNHGKNFGPWTTYTSGKYRQFLGQATAAAATGAGSTTSTGVPVSTPAATDTALLGGVDWQGLGLKAGAVGFGLALVVLGTYQAVGAPDLSGLAKLAVVA